MLQKIRSTRIGGQLEPLEVLTDTVINIFGSQSTEVVGVAINTTDTSLVDMVVALVLDGAGGVTAPGAVDGRDTLEYYLGQVPPGAVVGFTGGFVEWNERVVGRAAYPAARVVGRPIAGETHRHRVTWAVQKGAP